MASFYVIKGNDQGQQFELLESTSTIGRDSRNHIQLRDPEVSRRHARIEFDGRSYRLLDNGSSNGVQVNGKSVTDHVLVNGDRIRMGRTYLLFALNPSGFSSKSDDFLNQTTTPEEPTNGFGHGFFIASNDEYLHYFPLFAGSDDLSAEAIGHLKMMYHTTLVTTQTLEIGVLLHRILDMISEWVLIDRGCILIYDSDSLQLAPQAVWPLSWENDSEMSSRFAINRSIVEYVVKRQEGLLTGDTKNLEWDEDGTRYVRDVICVPMLGRYGLVGVIYIDRRNPQDPFSGNTPLPTGSNQNLSVQHLQLMIAVAHQAALAVEDTRYYKAMIRSERFAAVGETVTTLSHHIKNILQGISGGSHLIQTGLDRHNEDLVRQGWTIVEKNLGRISQLTLDMLTFSKEREPSYELADIVDTVTDIVELMQRPAEEAEVDLVFKHETTVPQFFFDVEQMHRALTNIVTNGIDAAKQRSETMKEDPEVDTGMETMVSIPVLRDEEQKRGLLQIEIDFRPEESFVLIVVDDNGPGIPALRRKKLFRPFYSQKKGRGTGLGLSVAHKVVREHGGVIRITDSPLGGARFEVELPLRLVPPDQRKS